MRKILKYQILKYPLMIILSISLLLVLSACEPYIPEVRQDFEVMGTYATIIVYHNDKEIAQNAINDAIIRIQEVDETLSMYKNTSEIYILNTQKMLSNPSKDVLFNIKKAIKFSQITEGNFDITVQPILDLYRYSFSTEGRTPTDEEIEETLPKVDYTKIMLDVSITIADEQKITLGGIAKGYAIDSAIEILSKNGINSALVNIGGDIRTLGMKPDGNGWIIALENPRNKNEYINILTLSNKSISTSGDYERYFDENKSFHHIVNPKTGYSATELLSVTIISDNSIDGDAAATSVFVMGPELGLKLIERMENMEGLLITSERDIIKSSGFDAYILK
jgi:FAD:protein FMN transferase